MNNRRMFVATCSGAMLGASLGMPLASFGEPPDSGDLWNPELQVSDPELIDESESLHDFAQNPENAYCASSWGYTKDPAQPVFDKIEAKALVDRVVGLSFVFADEKISRATSPKTIARFLRAFDLPFQYENGTYVPYCAAGLSYVLCRAFCELSNLPHDDANIQKVMKSVSRYYLFPSPSVRDIRRAAAEAGTWVPSAAVTNPKPGWPIIFSWSTSGVPNHIGLVTDAEGETIQTIEYNTSVLRDGNQRDGGIIARRIRRKDRTILGFVRLY